VRRAEDRAEWDDLGEILWFDNFRVIADGFGVKRGTIARLYIAGPVARIGRVRSTVVLPGPLRAYAASACSGPADVGFSCPIRLVVRLWLTAHGEQTGAE
jgi:hypothetical protein